MTTAELNSRKQAVRLAIEKAQQRLVVAGLSQPFTCPRAAIVEAMLSPTTTTLVKEK